MTIVADLGISKTMISFLQSKGMEVIRIVDIDPTMPDVEILEFANQHDALLITVDKDFGDLIYYSNKPHSGILLLRIEDASPNDFLKIIEHIFENHWNKIGRNFCVFKSGKLRIRNTFT
jgi:predicted nuclease of predicted toxin-antitoxin system